jgi:hypothetical protein
MRDRRARRKGDDLVEPAARFTLPMAGDGSIHVNMPEGSDGDVDVDIEDEDDDGPGHGSAAAFGREGVPRFLDLDGDGRDEIVIRGGAEGVGHILVFSIPRAAPAS